MIPVNAFAVRHETRDIPIKGIIINDNIVYSDVYPYIKNNRTYVPIRFIAEELGFDVKWNAKNRTVDMNNGSKVVGLTIGSDIMIVDGKKSKIDAPAEITDDRTMVPLRAISEAFGENVDYSEDYRAVYIGEDPKYNKFYNVVYYFGNEKPVISTYTINIATYKMNVNGVEKRYDDVDKMIINVVEDFENYYTNGNSSYGVKEYTSPATIKFGDKNNTQVPEDKQLKDNYYISPTEDVLVGSWYGRSTFSEFGTFKFYLDAYMYIESLGNNRYKITNRVIKQGDPNSEFFTEQYAIFNPTENKLNINDSHTTYGKRGYFANQSPYSYSLTYSVENNGRRLNAKDINNKDIYYNKY